MLGKLTIFLFLASGIYASTLVFDEARLVLNGSTIKEATFLAIDVYEVKFYVSEKSKNLDAILKQPRVAFKLKFLVDVSSKKLGAAWIEDLRAACEKDCKEQMKEARAFLPTLPNVKKGDVITYDITQDSVTVKLNATTLDTLKSKGLSKSLIKAFIGKTAPNQFREKLLGN